VSRVVADALRALQGLPFEEQLDVATRRLAETMRTAAVGGTRADGQEAGALARFDVADELRPIPGHVDGRLLEAVAAHGLGGARGAVFTGPVEATLLATLGLARVAARRGVPEREALAALAGAEPCAPELRSSLEGIRVLDPCCGGGALLVATLALARRCGFEPLLLGADVAPLAARAASERLRLLGAHARVSRGDALHGPWPEADLVLSNPPVLRHSSDTRRSPRRRRRAPRGSAGSLARRTCRRTSP
jgi:hypothetical protein